MQNKERRKYPRFDLKVDAKYKVLGSSEPVKSIRIKNIGAEGLCFLSNEKINLGSRIELEVNLSTKQPPVLVWGEVMWSNKAKKPGEMKYNNGIKILNIAKSDEGRFVKFYCDKMVKKLSSYLQP